MIALMQEDTRIDRDEGGNNLSIGYFIIKVRCIQHGLSVYRFIFQLTLLFELVEEKHNSINARLLINRTSWVRHAGTSLLCTHSVHVAGTVWNLVRNKSFFFRFIMYFSVNYFFLGQFKGKFLLGQN